MTNKQNAIDHLNNHQAYPATREELIMECNELEDFSKADKEWFIKHLPEGTYKSAKEVMKAVDL